MAPCLAHKHFRFTLFATLTDVYIQSLPLPQETHNSFEMGKSYIYIYAKIILQHVCISLFTMHEVIW